MSTALGLQPITAELREWILAQRAAGCAVPDVLQSMLVSGWHEDVARAALAQVLGQPMPQPAPSAPVPVPGPALAGAPSVIHLADRSVKVLMTLQLPRVVVFGEFMSDEECDGLMALAGSKLARSETVANDSGAPEVHEARTSEGMFLEPAQTPLVARLEQRIAALLNWPVERGEGLQVLRYRPGAEYKPHNDYFDPTQPGTAAVLRRGGQRVGTLVMYLNTPEQGGGTIFPDVQLEVSPVRGNAVFFSYDRPHADTRTLHGGSPVLAGEKWVATKWLREGVFV